jgi:para-nitrobenzyl esterase
MAKVGFRVGVAIGLWLAMSAMAQAQSPKPDGPVVRTAQGALMGETGPNNSFAFKGIPFAKAPVGDLRWRAPQPVAAWKGVRLAQKSAPACLQVSYGWNEKDAASSAEDCLYLELRTPTLEAAAKKPVMVFIHGGANRAGGGSGTISSAMVDEGVVLISLQYRLGVLGFMSHPALSAESAHKVSGNYALMDLIAGLEWVKANISAFGGDPDNVTIFGHSAGSHDVGLLLTSPLAKGLFHKAIMQSGTPQFGMAPRTLTQNEALGVDLAKTVGPRTEKDPASARALAALRAAPAKALQAAADKLDAPIPDDSFIWLQPTVDGYVLPRAPEDVFMDGDQAKVPLIIGMSARELGLHGGKEAVYSTIQHEFGERAFTAKRYYKLDINLDPPADPVLGSADLQLATDISFRCPSSWVADHQASIGQKVWLYQLDIDADPAKPAGHGSELAFVFNRPPAGATLSAWPPMMAYWTRFAATGEPRGPNLLEWAEFGLDDNYMAFSRAGPVVRQRLRGGICDMLNRP